MKQDVKELWYMIGTTVAVYGAIRYLLPLVVPFLFSYFFAKLLYPVVTIGRKKKKKWKRLETILACVITTGVLGAIGTGLFFLGKVILKQIERLVVMLPVYETKIMSRMEEICAYFDQTFSLQNGSCLDFVRQKIDLLMTNGRNSLTADMSWETFMELSRIFGVFWVVFIVVWGMILIIKDMDELKIIYQESWIYRHGSKVFEGLGEIGMAYGKAQLIIMSILFAVCSGGFILIGNSYAILLGLFVSVFDAFPVLGSGLILVPWAVISLFQGNWFHAAILFTLFVICQVVREWVEAKIIGNQIGIKPIFTIMSMYAGVKLFGVFGFILGPIALMIIKTVLRNQW